MNEIISFKVQKRGVVPFSKNYTVTVNLRLGGKVRIHYCLFIIIIMTDKKNSSSLYITRRTSSCLRFSGTERLNLGFLYLLDEK